MKQLFFFCIILSSFFNSQVIKDTVFGKPKYVKESVIFLNDSGPYTFMEGDDEYGHATIMTPKNLRESMRSSWFETHFCRYINNETHYDVKRNITKETWYYKSGEIVDDYDYTYDKQNRLIREKSKNKYSEKSSHYFYDKNSKTAKFKEYYSKWKDEPSKKYVNNTESFKPLFITKFDSLTKRDSIFAITNDVWKKYNDSAYIRGKDSIFHKRLSRIKIYDDHYRVVEEKFFNYEDDLQNKKIYLIEHLKYEYDNYDNVTKKIYFKDGKRYSYIMYGNGKIIKEEVVDEYQTPMYIIYNYTKDQKLERKLTYSNDKLWFDVKFEYKNNHITKLFLFR